MMIVYLPVFQPEYKTLLSVAQINYMIVKLLKKFDITILQFPAFMLGFYDDPHKRTHTFIFHMKLIIIFYFMKNFY